MVHLLQTIFYLKNIINIIFIYLLASFILRNFKKILKSRSRFMRSAIFGPKIPQFFLNKTFGTNHYYYFHLSIGPFHWTKLGKRPISPNDNFFKKPVNEPCFFHSCLSKCQKSKSDIYLLVKYRRLKNSEISLAENNFWL